MRIQSPFTWFAAILAAYTLIVGVSTARAEDPNEPNDTAETATAISYGYVSEGAEIDHSDDIDFYEFSGSQGDVIEIRTSNAPGSQLDGRIRLLSSTGELLAENDDHTSSLDSKLIVILDEDATYRIRYAYRLNLSLREEHRSGSRSMAEPRRKREVRGEPVGEYELTLQSIEPPAPAQLFAGTGFASLVPMTWSISQVTVLGAESSYAEIERSSDGGKNFDNVGTSTTTRFLDSLTTSGEELVYRVRMHHPYGIVSGPSEVARATPTKSGFQRTSPFTQTGPTIDGVIAIGEWSAAVRIPLTDESTGIETGTLYLMNDEDHLYVATESAQPTSEIGIYFDVNNDGSFGFSGTEGNYWIDDTRTIAFRPIRGAHPDQEFGEREENPDGVAAGLSQGLRTQYEVRFDLETSHVRARPGDVVGIYVYEFADNQFAGYPAGPGDLLFIAPLTFADITLEAPVPRIHLPVDQLDFDDTLLGNDREILTTIENLGIATLEISSLAFEGSDASNFTTSTLVPIQIEPDREAQVSVRFVPQGHGDFSATLVLTSNDPSSRTELAVGGSSPNQAPSVEIRNPATRGTGGQPIAIEAVVTDDISIAHVACEYVTGGGVRGEIELARETGDTYRGSIPGTAATEEGLLYRATAGDGEGASSTTSTYGVTIETARLQSPPVPGGSEQTSFRLVSVPSLLDDDGANTFSGSFGPYDPKTWRLFSYDSGSYTELNNRQRIAPGEALWLISREGGVLSTGAGESVPQSSPFKVSLDPGWNVLGHPFAYSVPANQVRLASGGKPDIRIYEGSWSSHTKGLTPWQGYAVFSETSDELLVDPSGTLGTTPDPPANETSTGSRQESSSSDADSGPGWEIRISASCEHSVDNDNAAGVRAESRSDRDRFDLAEPPTIGDFISLFFPHEEFDSVSDRFCTDIRGPGSDRTWTFQVESNIDNSVLLEFDLAELPSGLHASVVDRVTGVIWELRTRPKFEIGSAIERSRTFDLFVGSFDDVRNAAESTQATIALSAKHLGFPNPFRSAVTIFYQLPGAGIATVSIYTVSGQRVQTLSNREPHAAGRHSRVWDGQTSSGQQAPSGTYFYRIESETEVSRGRLVLIR